MFEQNAFGRTDAGTIGAEEELILVDPRTNAIAHRSDEVLRAMEIPAGSAHHDFYEALLELTSPICTNADEAIRGLHELRAAMRSAGGSAVGAGLHPSAQFGNVRASAGERYRWVEDSHAGATFRTPEAAFHVHIGMPDPESAIRAFNGLRNYLPVFVALSANSPFWYGMDSGFASARAVHNKAYPRFDIPPAFSRFEDYATTIETLVGAGQLPDYTLVWWEVRPHPRLGTVEVRAMDSQSDLRSATGLAALVHGLAVHESQNQEIDHLPREIVAENCFRASRYGLATSLWWEGSLVPIRELVSRAVDVAWDPAAQYGSDAALEEIGSILRDGNGADRQRAAFARGGMDALLQHLRTETDADL